MPEPYDGILVNSGGALALRTADQAKTALALVKGDVGLGSVDNTSDAGKPVSIAQQTALNLKADKSGTLDQFTTPTSVNKIGYDTGAGGTVTQLTSKTTAVTLNKLCGQITMNGAALAAAAEAKFVVTNSQVAAVDVVIVNHGSAGTSGAYAVVVTRVAAGAFDITVTNLSAGSLSEAIVINFAIIKAVSS